MIRTLCLIILALCPLLSITKAQATPIIADLAIRSVDIDHNFDGLNVLMYGAQNDAGRIVVALRGPKKTYVVRRKERIAGIWVNKKSISFEDTNSFYALASTHQLADIRNDNLLNNLEIGINNIHLTAITRKGEPVDEATEKIFKDALIKAKLSNKLYSGTVEPVSFWGETLFRTTLEFPKNISRGWYTAEIYLFSDGILRAVQSTPIEVSKIGMSAFIFDAAHNNSLLYGIMCVLMALIAGWSANALFKRT
jgi:uncharacterized protein (TIGR02186 family)